MSDVIDNAFKVGKYLYDHEGIATTPIEHLRKVSGLSPEDFEKADAFMIDNSYFEGTSTNRGLTLKGKRFMKARLVEMSAVSSAKSNQATVPQRRAETKNVFIIHGHDLDARDELIKLLRSLGLSHLDFEDVADEMGGVPFIADIVLKGIGEADAVIALFTPDELAALYDPRTGEYQGAERFGSRWQSRPNVIFEAGVALGTAKSKTILVTLGTNVELFSDASGIHFIDLISKSGKKSLRKRLAGIVGDMGVISDDWEDTSVSGDFRRCLRQRWPHFDELAELEARLRATVIDDSTDLMAIVSSVVINRERYDWDRQVTSEPFMNSVSELYGEKIAEGSYWWFLVYGFLRFAEEHPWWDGKPTWKNSARFSIIAERGLKLMAKLDKLVLRIRPG